MAKKLFTVRRAWFGVVVGDVVELEADENGTPVCAAIIPNVEPAPEDAKVTEEKKVAPALPKVK